MSNTNQSQQVLFACSDADRDAIENVLTKTPSGQSWAIFNSGAAALKHLITPSNRPALALISENLPDLDALDCAHRLRETQPEMALIILGRYDSRYMQALGELRIDEFIARDTEGEVFEQLPALLEHLVLKHVAPNSERPSYERHVSSLLQNIPEIVFELAPDGTVLHANREAEVIGWPLSMLGQVKIDDLMIEEDAARARENLTQLIDGETLTQKNLYHVQTTEGAIIPLQVQTVLLRRPNEKTRILGVARDISELEHARTEQKHLESRLRRAQKMEAVGRLAGGIAHDFNNILTGIHGYAELTMVSLGEENPLYADVSEIRTASERAARLVQQLLAFSRKQIVEPKVLNLNAVLDDMTTMLVSLLGEEVTLDFQPREDLWKIKADPGQIEQILVNLISNASDAIPGRGEVTIHTANRQVESRWDAFGGEHKPGPYVMIALSDTGKGMGADTLQHVFEPFFTTKQADQGTGLGLSMVYGVLKQNRGFVEVESVPGAGTTFRLFFPQALEHPDEIAGTKTATQTQGNETVLLVEDEDVVRVLARSILQRQGYKVIEAGDGESAYQLCKELHDQIDLLLTDVIMPNMNGKELYDELRKLRPDLRAIFMSGYTADSIAERGIVEEGINFLQKPFSVKALAAKVRQVLDS